MNARRTPQKKGGSNSRRGIRRRDFLATTAAAGAGFWLTSPLRAAEPASKNDELHIGIIGTGVQGLVLVDNCLKIPGIRFVAVCDIWPYSQRYALRRLKAYRQEVNAYEDYREMLDKEKALDAVLVATPDWMHAEQTIACLQAGKHVYCEKEMSNSLEQAKQMVLAARQTGKLLQIGHQRRSNPLYTHSLEKIIREAKLLGRIITAQGQWNRDKVVSEDRGWPKEYELDEATLKKYGYDTMHQFRNWRWYRKYGGGPIEDLGSHQIDIFNWFLGVPPKSVIASGGMDYYKGHEWYDNVMAIYEYDTPEGVVRALYQVQTATSDGGYYEKFRGDDGTLRLSEDPRKCYVKAADHLRIGAWDKWAEKGYLAEEGYYVRQLCEQQEKKDKEDEKIVEEIIECFEPPFYPCDWHLPVKPEGSYHQAHLENFFDALRNGTPLNCPPEVAYETAVTVLTVNDAVAAGKRIDFKPEEFKV
jgi:predicted dehydrogenase